MQPTKLQELIYSMLTENTGEAMMDSGGAYGRHWQENSKKTIQGFMNEPECWLDSPLEPHPTVSVFHYLSNVLNQNKLCEEFNTLPSDNWDSDLMYGLSTEGEAWLNKRGFQAQGEIFNTYNGDSLLSQTLQGLFLSRFNQEKNYTERYILLQIHGGYDVRGGYTDAKLFEVENFTEPLVLGTVDGKSVDTAYDGSTLTDTDDGTEITLKPDSKIDLFVEFNSF